MISVPALLYRAMRGRYERLPVWPPGSTIELGDVGYLDAHRWVKVTTLAELGMSASHDRPGKPTDIDLSSEKGVTAEQRVDANSTVAGGQIEFRFTASEAFVLKSHQVVTTRLANLRDLQRQILALPSWEQTWTVITETSVGGPSCVLVAGHTGAHATVHVGTQPLLPIGLTSRLTLGTRHGMAAAWVTSEPAAIMMRAHYLRRRILGTTRLHDRGDRGNAPQPVQSEQHIYLAEVVEYTDLPKAAPSSPDNPHFNEPFK